MIGQAVAVAGDISVAAATTISTAAAVATIAAVASAEEAAVIGIARALSPLAPSAEDTSDDETRDADQYEAGEQLDHILAPSAVDTLKGNQQ